MKCRPRRVHANQTHVSRRIQWSRPARAASAPAASSASSPALVTERARVFPHSLMRCALARRVSVKQRRLSSEQSRPVPDRVSRGCTVSPEGSGGGGFRVPIRETQTRTQRIDARFWVDVCGEWAWHFPWYARHVCVNEIWKRPRRCAARCCQTHVNFCCIASDAFCGCLCARGQTWTLIHSLLIALRGDVLGCFWLKLLMRSYGMYSNVKLVLISCVKVILVSIHYLSAHNTNIVLYFGKCVKCKTESFKCIINCKWFIV